MPGRSFNSPNYRYGFNGKENDKEWGNQLIQDYGFRLYNPALAKFLSVDPLAPDYPSWSPYPFAMNSPISGVDLDGLEYYFSADGAFIGKWGTSTEIQVIQNTSVESFVNSANNHSVSPNYNPEEPVDLGWFSRKPTFSDKENISIDHVIPTSTFEKHSDHLDCYIAACKTLENNNYEPGEFWGKKEIGLPYHRQYKYQMYSESGIPSGGTEETRKLGFKKLNEELEAGRPVLVGLDYESGSNNPGTDKTTEHFIVLTGRGFDDEGKMYYTGFENVAKNESKGTSTESNRFYIQSNGLLEGKTVFTSATITQVRPVKEIENNGTSN